MKNILLQFQIWSPSLPAEGVFFQHYFKQTSTSLWFAFGSYKCFSQRIDFFEVTKNRSQKIQKINIPNRKSSKLDVLDRNYSCSLKIVQV